MPSNPSTPASRPHLRARFVRLALGILVSSALVLPAAAGPAADAVTAGGSCTGWKSTTRPPKTIRVLRWSGHVEVVDFKRYVIVVTAKEWPSYIPQAAIETGATAVKQYGWYKTLAGNHRTSFVNKNGKCYDVVDGTRDQLYKPRQANVTEKVRRAVNSIWGLSLRKSGKFFETGYRTGTSNRCGRDANGRLLYAKSVIDCARRGLSRQEIQFRYYGKSLTLHWTDGRVIGYKSQQAAASAPQSTPNATPQPEPAATPKPKATAQPQATPKATRQIAPKATPQPEPAATAKPKAKAKPQAKAGPRPQRKAQLTQSPKAEPAPTTADATSAASRVALMLPGLEPDYGEADPSSVLVALPAAPAADGAMPGAAEVSMPTVYSLPWSVDVLPDGGDYADLDAWLSDGTAAGMSEEAVVARVHLNADEAWVIY